MATTDDGEGQRWDGVQITVRIVARFSTEGQRAPHDRPPGAYLCQDTGCQRRPQHGKDFCADHIARQSEHVAGLVAWSERRAREAARALARGPERTDPRLGSVGAELLEHLLDAGDHTLRLDALAAELDLEPEVTAVYVRAWIRLGRLEAPDGVEQGRIRVCPSSGGTLEGDPRLAA